MDKLSNSTKSGAKVKKSKLNDMNFNLLNNLTNLNNLNHLNTNHLTANQLTSNYLNNFTNNANQHFNNNLTTNQLPDQLCPNQSSLNSLLYPNLQLDLNNQLAANHLTNNLYQQQSSSKLTLSSSNFISPNPFAFHPYLTDVIQRSLLNSNFLQNNLISQPHQSITQPDHQTDLNSLNNLNFDLNSNTTNGFNYLRPEFNHLTSLDHLNQFSKNLNLLNETFLSNLNSNGFNHLVYPNQLSNNFNFNFLNPVSTSSSQIHKSSTKRAKLDPTTNELKIKKNFGETLLNQNFEFKEDFFETNLKSNLIKDNNLRDDFKKEFKSEFKNEFKNEFKKREFKNDFTDVFNDNLKCDFKDEFKNDLIMDTKEDVQKFKELKVQTINDDKLEDEKTKFSPDSSTELLVINKQPKNHIHSINNSINNQSSIITSTKHSTSPDIQSTTRYSTDQSLKFNDKISLIKEEDDQIDCFEEKKFTIEKELNLDLCVDDSAMNNHDLNGSLENDENSLKIDLNVNDQLTDEEKDLTNHESISFKKSIGNEELYSLISNKSFQPINHFKEVSLDRMSFDEDEDDEDRSPINFNFKNLIDNDLNCSDIKDDETSPTKRNKSTKKRKDNDTNLNSTNPWSIRRSERIFLNEAFNSNSNNCFSFDPKNPNFKLTIKDLDEPKRILVQNDDLLYSGLATKDELTNKICVSLDDCAKNNQIYSIEKLLQEAIREIKIKSIDQLYDGCRVAAFWSSKTKYLYPGKIVKSSDIIQGSNANLNSNKKDLVLIHFDDGDRTKIGLDEIRLLPSDFELKQQDTDEETNNESTIKLIEEKKVEKLKIKLNCNTTNDKSIKKKKKKHSRDRHSKERHHKHHHRKHRDTNDDEQSTDEGNIFNGDAIENEEDDWWPTISNNHQWKWKWHGKPLKIKKTSKNSRSKKTFYKAIIRGNDEIIELNDCAVFLSTGKTTLPFIGRIVKMFSENNLDNMIVNVKWFYHPEEIETRKPHPKLLDTKGALFESAGHFDDNDVQTISHRVLVLSYNEYLDKKSEITSEDEDDIYYYSGVYDPAKKRIISLPKDVPMKR